MNDYHVLIPDSLDDVALAVFADVPSVHVTASGNMDRAQTIAAIPQADALIIRSATQVDEELLAAASKLRVVARAGVGVDNVDLAEATRRGVVVMNTPDGNTIAAAEHAFALMLALARHVPQAHNSLASGAWDRKRFMGVELRGKTLGLIGLGRIGRAVARRASAFEMTVVAHDPFLPDPSLAAEIGVELVDLETLYARSDFISVHALVTDETRDMINRDSIAAMKQGVRIVNVARGAIINPSDLADAIRAGQVAGAAVDVYEEEPPPSGHPLIGLPGVIHTPHLGASTFDAQVQVALDAAKQVRDALLDGVYRNVVNPEALPSAS